MPHQEPLGAPRTRRTPPLRGAWRTRTSPRLLAPFLASLLALALVAGCTGEDGSGQRAGGPGGRGEDAGRPASSVPTVVVPGQRVGRLAPQRHRQVAQRVAAVVDGWWDAAFVEADYPRERYQDSFPGFTRTAAAQAWQQRDLMTSARLGPRIDTLVPLRRRVAVDVLSTREVPRGATARVRMDFRTTGEVERRIRLEGRLALTYLRGGWRVFGFDVTQSPLQPPPGRTSGEQSDQQSGKGSGQQSGRQQGGKR